MKSVHQVAASISVLLLTQPLLHAADTSTLTVETSQPGVAINHGMWGIFFEDINFGADGGLYAEMVENRGFEFPDPLMGWIKIINNVAHGEVSIRDGDSFDAANPHYVRLESEGGAPLGVANEGGAPLGVANEGGAPLGVANEGGAPLGVANEGGAPLGVANEGFRGMGVKSGESYNFSAEVRNVSGTPTLRIDLYSGDSEILDTVRIKDFSSDWKKYTAVLHPKTTDAKAKLYVQIEGKGSVDLDFISLFPEHSWKNRPGGLRADMVQALADLHPGFLRFPGGCIVEGSTLAGRYQWKKTIGPVEERPLLINRWNKEFTHRPTPDYYQSFGLGFYEYFQLCEDIGASPLPILNCGMACQFNSGELCPMDELGPYIQDALDLIEFANGPADSEWGAKRAAMGHPEPFHLKMMGVGNEQWGQQYIDRYTKFAQAIKAKYPGIKLVSAAGPSPDDDRFKFAWPKLRALHADIVDEHCYANPSWFFENTHRYDKYDRNGPKVFFGEYAAQSVATVSVKNRNNLECALSEAACMTGLERNGDVVCMASYAPLFANVDAWQWKPDLIWVNSLAVLRTPNYYVQKMFANNPGDETVPVKLDTTDGAKLYASATRDNASGDTILKVVNGANAPAEVKLDFFGAQKIASSATVFTLTGNSGSDENTFADPNKILPQESQLEIAAPQFSHAFPANSLTVMRLKTTN